MNVSLLLSRRRALLAAAAFGLVACSEKPGPSRDDPSLSERDPADLFPNRPVGGPALQGSSPASSPADPYGLNVNTPPPIKPYDPADDDPEVQLRAKLYDHLALISQAARTLFHSPRIRQSLEIHLSYVDAVESVPRVRRRDLRALEDAGRTSFSQMDLAKTLQSLLTLDEVMALRAAFATPALHTFAVLLGTSVTIPGKSVLDAVSSASAQSEWRRSALAWLTTATRSEQVERDIAQRALPYVVANLGLSPERALPAAALLKARADGLAFARTHVATQDMSDRELYGLVRNFQEFGVSRGYEAFFQAYKGTSNTFLIAVHDNLA